MLIGASARCCKILVTGSSSVTKILVLTHANGLPVCGIADWDDVAGSWTLPLSDDHFRL
eukprot:gene48730-22734_t